MWTLASGSPLVRSSGKDSDIDLTEIFNGIGMGRRRGDLRKRLDLVLRQLDPYIKGHRPDLEFSTAQGAGSHYGELTQVLLEVDGEAMEILTRTPPRFAFISFSSVRLRPRCEKLRSTSNNVGDCVGPTCALCACKPVDPQSRSLGSDQSSLVLF